MDPGRLQKMLATQWPLGSIEEGDEQRIFSLGQCDLVAGRCGQAARAEAQAPPSELIASTLVVAWRDRVTTVEAPQHRAHSGQKLPQVKGFGHIVVGAQLETDDAVDLVAAVTGRDDDRNVALLSDFPQQVETIFEAESKIQDDNADLVRGKLTKHFFATRCEERLDVVVGEIV